MVDQNEEMVSKLDCNFFLFKIYNGLCMLFEKSLFAKDRNPNNLTITKAVT